MDAATALAELFSTTATSHHANLMQKLDAHNQIELVRAAARGLILMPPGGGESC